MRQAIAAAMSRSKREIPHFYLAATIDMKAMTTWLRGEQRRAAGDRAAAARGALHQGGGPGAARGAGAERLLAEQRVRPGAGIHPGVAVSLRGGGLVAPALHDADQKDLPTLMSALRDLVMRARAGELRSSELSDPTITITNLGEQGVEASYGIIYPPQVALVSFGAIVDRPVAVDGEVQVHPTVHGVDLGGPSRRGRPSRRALPYRAHQAAAITGDPMTSQEIRDLVVKGLNKIAPESKGLRLEGGQNLRDQLDIDSMDMLNFVIGLHEALHVDIPEADYAKLATLDGAVAYLASRLGGSSPTS